MVAPLEATQPVTACSRVPSHGGAFIAACGSAIPARKFEPLSSLAAKRAPEPQPEQGAPQQRGAPPGHKDVEQGNAGDRGGLEALPETIAGLDPAQLLR